MRWISWLRLLFIGLLILAGPNSNFGYSQETSRCDLDLLILMDNSLSLSEQDPNNLRERVIRFLSNYFGLVYANNSAGRVGVLGFADETTILVPFKPLNEWSTDDFEAITSSEQGGRTDFVGVLEQAESIFNENGSLEIAGCRPTILLVSDGGLDRNPPAFSASGYATLQVQPTVTRLQSQGIAIAMLAINPLTEHLSLWQNEIGLDPIYETDTTLRSGLYQEILAALLPVDILQQAPLQNNLTTQIISPNVPDYRREATITFVTDGIAVTSLETAWQLKPSDNPNWKLFELQPSTNATAQFQLQGDGVYAVRVYSMPATITIVPTIPEYHVGSPLTAQAHLVSDPPTPLGGNTTAEGIIIDSRFQITVFLQNSGNASYSLNFNTDGNYLGLIPNFEFDGLDEIDMVWQTIYTPDPSLSISPVRLAIPLPSISPSLSPEILTGSPSVQTVTPVFITPTSVATSITITPVPSSTPSIPPSTLLQNVPFWLWLFLILVFGIATIIGTRFYATYRTLQKNNQENQHKIKESEAQIEQLDSVSQKQQTQLQQLEDDKQKEQQNLTRVKELLEQANRDKEDAEKQLQQLEEDKQKEQQNLSQITTSLEQAEQDRQAAQQALNAGNWDGAKKRTDKGIKKLIEASQQSTRVFQDRAEDMFVQLFGNPNLPEYIEEIIRYAGQTEPFVLDALLEALIKERWNDVNKLEEVYEVLAKSNNPLFLESFERIKSNNPVINLFKALNVTTKTSNEDSALGVIFVAFSLNNEIGDYIASTYQLMLSWSKQDPLTLLQQGELFESTQKLPYLKDLIDNAQEGFKLVEGSERNQEWYKKMQKQLKEYVSKLRNSGFVPEKIWFLRQAERWQNHIEAQLLALELSEESLKLSEEPLLCELRPTLDIYTNEEKRLRRLKISLPIIIQNFSRHSRSIELVGYLEQGGSLIEPENGIITFNAEFASPYIKSYQITGYATTKLIIELDKQEKFNLTFPEPSKQLITDKIIKDWSDDYLYNNEFFIGLTNGIVTEFGEICKGGTRKSGVFIRLRGINGSGRTTILEKIKAELLAKPDFMPISISFSEWADGDLTEWLCSEISHKIQLNEEPPGIGVEDIRSQLWSTKSQKEKRVVLLLDGTDKFLSLDHLEKIQEVGYWLDDFIRDNLLSIVMSHNYTVATWESYFYMYTKRSVKRLPYFQEKRIRLLDQKEVDYLLKNLDPNRFTQIAINTIWILTGGHPALLKRLVTRLLKINGNIFGEDVKAQTQLDNQGGDHPAQILLENIGDKNESNVLVSLVKHHLVQLDTGQLRDIYLFGEQWVGTTTLFARLKQDYSPDYDNLGIGEVEQWLASLLEKDIFAKEHNLPHIFTPIRWRIGWLYHILKNKRK